MLCCFNLIHKYVEAEIVLVRSLDQSINSHMEFDGQDLVICASVEDLQKAINVLEKT
jgi:hypothetical protein